MNRFKWWARVLLKLVAMHRYASGQVSFERVVDFCIRRGIRT